MAELREYRVTFGVMYRREPHPTFPAADPDGWLTVMAPDEESARALVVDRIGRAWAFIYSAERMTEHYYPHGEITRWSTEVEASMADREIDIFNRYLVGAHGGGVVVLNPSLRGFVLTGEDARVFAAWLVAVADGVDPDGAPFDEVLAAVRNT